MSLDLSRILLIPAFLEKLPSKHCYDIMLYDTYGNMRVCVNEQLNWL